MSKVVVTGATGFVGSATISALAECGYEVAAIARRNVSIPGAMVHVVGDLVQAPESTVELLADADVLVHLAARVHVMRKTHGEASRQEFQRVNVEATRRLAEYAARAGCRRFVFVSSVKVHGEATVRGRPFTVADRPQPEDPYGQSKLDAENALQDVAARTGMELAIVRPPLVYGPGVAGNFQRLLRWVESGVPLPFAAISNSRSMVSVFNLVDLLRVCVEHPRAAGQTFLVSDGEDLSTPELITRIARVVGRPARLFPVPPALLTWAAKAVGRGADAQRLCASLQVDIAATRECLGWVPPYDVESSLERMIR